MIGTLTRALALAALTQAGHYFNADGTPHDPYHDLHLPHEPPLYPTLHSVPHTSFSCEGREWGYYADTEAYCQLSNKKAYFFIALMKIAEELTKQERPLFKFSTICLRTIMFWYQYIPVSDIFIFIPVYHLCQGHLLQSYLCTNGTLFHDHFKVCDQFYNVRCGVPLEDY